MSGLYTFLCGGGAWEFFGAHHLANSPVCGCNAEDFRKWKPQPPERVHFGKRKLKIRLSSGNLEDLEDPGILWGLLKGN